MKKIIINLVLVFSIISFGLISCDRVGDENVGGTSTEDMSGDWFVTTSVSGTQVLGYEKISTYNTSANDGKEFWVDDHGNIWTFKVKSPIDYSAKTFAGTDLASSVDDYDVDVTITNGKVLKGAATTTGGNKSDSIYFEAEFSDDPGVIYTIAGYKRTGFLEDEH